MSSSSACKKNLKCLRKSISKGKLPNFVEGDYVLVSREYFHTGEKICLQWQSPGQIVKALNHYVYQVIDLRNGPLTHFPLSCFTSKVLLWRITQLEFRHVSCSELWYRYAGFASTAFKWYSRFYHGSRTMERLCISENTLEPIFQVHDTISQVCLNLHERKATSSDLSFKVRASLGLWKWLCDTFCVHESRPSLIKEIVVV